MTKLKEMLIDLDYESDLIWSSYSRICYKKECNFHTLEIYLNTLTGKISVTRVLSNTSYKDQQDIDDLQKAFNQLQNDLEVLKEYEVD